MFFTHLPNPLLGGGHPENTECVHAIRLEVFQALVDEAGNLRAGFHCEEIWHGSPWGEQVASHETRPFPLQIQALQRTSG